MPTQQQTTQALEIRISEVRALITRRESQGNAQQAETARNELRTLALDYIIRKCNYGPGLWDPVAMMDKASGK